MAQSTVQLASTLTTPSGADSVPTRSYTAGAFTQIEETVSAGTTVTIQGSVDVSARKMLHINSDKSVTLVTNTSGTHETVALVPNSPLIETDDMYHDPLISVDVSQFIIRNPGTTDATIKIRILQDPTP